MGVTKDPSTTIPPPLWNEVKEPSAGKKLIQKSKETPFVPIGEVILLSPKAFRNQLCVIADVGGEPIYQNGTFSL